MITAQQLAAALRAAANSLDGNPAAQGVSTFTPVPVVDVAAQQAAAFAAQQAAAFAAQQAQQAQNMPTVTAEQVTALIQPHIGNDAIKAALGDAMRALGVNNLPDAQPHHFGPLYSSFQQVLARFGIGGAGAPAPVSTSII